MNNFSTYMQKQACPIIMLARSTGSIAISEQNVPPAFIDLLVQQMDESNP